MSKAKWFQKPIHVLLVFMIVLGLSLATAAPTMAGQKIYEHYNTGDIGETNGPYGTSWFAQTFTAESYHDVTSVKLKLGRYGNPGTVTVAIKATDASGHPTGPDLASGTTNGNTLPLSSPGEWRQIKLDASCNLTYGMKYAIVIRARNGTWSNYLKCMVDTDGGYPYGDGELSLDGGGSWSGPNVWDLMFEIYGTAALPGPTVNWHCPLGGMPLIAPYPSSGRLFLTVTADPAEIAVSAGAELWGIYFLNETTGQWLYSIPGFANSTLTVLQPEKYYYVIVSAPCTLTIPQ